MAPKFSRTYLDALFAAPEFMKLVEIAGYFPGSETYRREAADFGLPLPVFLFQETLTWFSQSIRSGVWTYYEATPRARQEAMYRALVGEAPPGYAVNYARGMDAWRDAATCEAVDTWIAAHEEDHHRWLWRLVSQYRPLFERVCGQIGPTTADRSDLDA